MAGYGTASLIGLHHQYLQASIAVMPPKTLPPQAKLNLILTYFHTTNIAHSIKDLEKSLPGAAGISPMVVKDFLTALSDEGLIRVEKIGSGNWYWSFKSDEKKQKGRILEGLDKELVKLGKAVQDARAALLEEGVEEEGLELRRVMAARIEGLTKTKGEMEEELRRNDPGAVDRRRVEIAEMKASVNRYTDNLYTLESYVREATSNDREKMEACRKMFGMEEELEYV